MPLRQRLLITRRIEDGQSWPWLSSFVLTSVVVPSRVAVRIRGSRDALPLA